MHVRIIVHNYITEAESDPHTVAYETIYKIGSLLDGVVYFDEGFVKKYFDIRKALENGLTFIKGEYKDDGQDEEVGYSIEVLDQKVNP